VDEREMRRRAEDARVARLATVRADGRPHLVPIVFALDDDTVYSAVDAKPKRSPELRRLDNIRANGRVELLIDHYEEDWSRVWWVRLVGSARVVEEGPDHERGLSVLREKYPQYDTWPPLGAVVVIEIEAWRGWSAAPD
jgi:PPOX class probable F420-dependent enzyme